MMITISLVAVLLLSYVGTWAIKWHALKHAMLMDQPNGRSSHSVPTPRGGGVAIVLAFFVGAFFAAPTDPVFFNALLYSGLLVAALGFVDDYRGLGARWRLLGHLLAAGWALYCFNGLPVIEVFGVGLSLAGFECLLAVLAIAWLINLFNFMDGIDGIAAVQALCVSLSGALFYVVIGHEGLAVWPLLLAAAALGFAFWNFPPAKIFMGDAGSGFLGLMMALLTLQAAWVESSLLFAWLIMQGVFIVDASFTLSRRLFTGEKVHEAHRSHAYQIAARRLNSHFYATVLVALINLGWLLPLALLAVFQQLSGALLVLLAYTPLIILARYLNAGSKLA